MPMTRSTEPVGQAVEHGLGLAVALEAGQRLHDDREPGVALGEGVDVLLDEQRRGAQHATCLPSCTALNAARTAISVLP